MYRTIFKDNYPLGSVSFGKLKRIPSRTKGFSKIFFPCCIGERNKLNLEVRNAKSICKFRKLITAKQLENYLCNAHIPTGVKLLSRLRMQFTHLSEHKFRHGFNDTVNRMSPCRTDADTTEHFLLRFHCFYTQRSELFVNLYSLDPSFSKLNFKEKGSYLLHSSTSNSISLNKDIVKLVIKFPESTGGFKKPLIFD